MAFLKYALFSLFFLIGSCGSEKPGYPSREEVNANAASEGTATKVQFLGKEIELFHEYEYSIDVENKVLIVFHPKDPEGRRLEIRSLYQGSFEKLLQAWVLHTRLQPFQRTGTYEQKTHVYIGEGYITTYFSTQKDSKYLNYMNFENLSFVKSHILSMQSITTPLYSDWVHFSDIARQIRSVFPEESFRAMPGHFLVDPWEYYHGFNDFLGHYQDDLYSFENFDKELLQKIPKNTVVCLKLLKRPEYGSLKNYHYFKGSEELNGYNAKRIDYHLRRMDKPFIDQKICKKFEIYRRELESGRPTKVYAEPVYGIRLTEDEKKLVEINPLALISFKKGKKIFLNTVSLPRINSYYNNENLSLATSNFQSLQLEDNNKCVMKLYLSKENLRNGGYSWKQYSFKKEQKPIISIHGEYIEIDDIDYQFEAFESQSSNERSADLEIVLRHKKIKNCNEHDELVFHSLPHFSSTITLHADELLLYPVVVKRKKVFNNSGDSETLRP